MAKFRQLAEVSQRYVSAKDRARKADKDSDFRAAIYYAQAAAFAKACAILTPNPDATGGWEQVTEEMEQSMNRVLNDRGYGSPDKL